jgi:hypothetical protein
LIYYEFSKKKPISKINKRILEKKTFNSDTWQHQSMPRGMLTSAWRHWWGQYLLMSAVGPADVIVDGQR